MKPSLDVRPLILLAVVTAAFFFFTFRFGDNEPAPSFPKTGPELVPVFQKSSNLQEAAHHAKVFGTICKTLADTLERDATLPEPRMKFGSQVDDFRIAIRDMRFSGSLAQKYPDLGPAANEFLTEEIGTWGGPIDEDSPDDPKKRTHRQRWIDAYRQLAECAFYADYKLRH